jgi:hypothetical protein
LGAALVAAFFMRDRMSDMKYRKLRIAWSVAWGVVAVLICVLWVRSYWIRDTAWIPGRNYGTEVNSLSGQIALVIWDKQEFGGSLPPYHVSHKRIDPENTLISKPNILGFFYHTQPNMVHIAIPFWFPALSVLALAGTPVVPWSNRFRLRTLLIATTLIAVALGLIVWAAK